MGDLVLSTPAIATVRASFPDARITMVTSAYNHIVMDRNTDVDEIVDLPREIKPAAFGSRYRDYDVAIALAPRSVDLQLVGATRARVRVGYTYQRRWLARLTSRLYVNRTMTSVADPEVCERDPSLVVPHEVDQLLALVELAGARTRVDRLRLDLRDEDRERVERYPASPIVLHLGARWFGSGSTAQSTIALARELRERAPLVLSCPSECEAYAQAFEAEGFAVAKSLPFFVWAALFERARCVVTVDTGATHVASAVRRPTLVAFEHRYFRLNSQEWAPYRVPSVLVRKPEVADERSLAQFRAEIIRGVERLINVET
jgi:ADP-heptose:LPS heptosyltransferase